MNMGIDQWKQKYLFPFGDIKSAASTEESSAYYTTPGLTNLRASPFKLNQSSQYNNLREDSIFSSETGSKFATQQNSLVSLAAHTPEVTGDAVFEKLTKQMFKFPAYKVVNNAQWFEELQHPLDFTVAEINTDLSKFVKDFPMDMEGKNAYHMLKKLGIQYCYE